MLNAKLHVHREDDGTDRTKADNKKQAQTDHNNNPVLIVRPALARRGGGGQKLRVKRKKKGETDTLRSLNANQENR